MHSAVFESFVNSEEYQTKWKCVDKWNEFESFVNSEEYQTNDCVSVMLVSFESFVNSEEYQTGARRIGGRKCLRALLIQKSIKRMRVRL